MRGNSHVRFLGGGEGSNALDLPDSYNETFRDQTQEEMDPFPPSLPRQMISRRPADRKFA